MEIGIKTNSETLKSLGLSFNNSNRHDTMNRKYMDL